MGQGRQGHLLTPAQVCFQAHRGGLEEAPENTLAALRRAWDIPGAVPEIDVRTTRDRTLVCLHDPTLARTTDAADGVREADVCTLLVEDVRKWDAGSHFSRRFKKENVPTFAQVIDEMGRDEGRRLYVDYKHVDPLFLELVLRENQLEDRVILTHHAPEELRRLRRAFPTIDTMTWCAGTPEAIARCFDELAAGGFDGLTQVQVHLDTTGNDPVTYALDDAFLSRAGAALAAAGADLQVRPFAYDATSLRHLLDLGIHWYVTDAPRRFAAALAEAGYTP